MEGGEESAVPRPFGRGTALWWSGVGGSLAAGGLWFLVRVEERADLVGVGCGADRLAGLGEPLHAGGVGVEVAEVRPEPLQHRRGVGGRVGEEGCGLQDGEGGDGQPYRLVGCAGEPEVAGDAELVAGDQVVEDGVGQFRVGDAAGQDRLVGALVFPVKFFCSVPRGF